jgi:cob(I)alamin adenosyltransferase
MGYRLSRITTRTGDQGDTGLADGTRLAKSSQRIVAIGAVDELNSWIGLVLAQPLPDDIAQALAEVQHDLFEVGAELSLPGHTRVGEEHVSRLEAVVGALNERLEPLREFILPGGTQAAALCHVARTVCRRAETHLVSLRAADAMNVSVAEPAAESWLVPYLNRLSDVLFVAARSINRQAGAAETLWKNVRPRKA